MLLAILALAAGLRVWAPWDDVLSGPRVNFLETDAWYHVLAAARCHDCVRRVPDEGP